MPGVPVAPPREFGRFLLDTTPDLRSPRAVQWDVALKVVINRADLLGPISPGLGSLREPPEPCKQNVSVICQPGFYGFRPRILPDPFCSLLHSCRR